MRAPCVLQPPPAFVPWPGLTPYAQGVALQEDLAAQVRNGGPESIVLCEHEPLLTLGSSAKAPDTGQGHGLPCLPTNRGGQVTYHGPGQRVLYPIVRLDARWNTDVRQYMNALQRWVQAACATLGVEAELRTGPQLGLWVGEAKLAAFGVKISRGVAYHGAALNVCNDVDIYRHFTPCGIKGSRATRLIDHAPSTTMAQVDAALKATVRVFINP